MVVCKGLGLDRGPTNIWVLRACLNLRSNFFGLLDTQTWISNQTVNRVCTGVKLDLVKIEGVREGGPRSSVALDWAAQALSSYGRCH